MIFARFLLGSAALALTAFTGLALAEQPATTLTTLLDKAQIQDMLVDYYGQLGKGRDDFGAFYVEDGTLDVNGLVAQGQQPIEELYKKVGQGSPKWRAFRMLLTNIKVVVNGDTATADMIWTGVNSQKLTAPPEFVEQGREHDDLVKRNGRWYFKYRVITSDGGLTAMFEKSYKKR